MLVKEIEPIDKVGVNFLEQDESLNLIDEIIELPLRNACKIFKQKGIETVMSSANKNNILPLGEKPTEREDVHGKLFLDPAPTFVDAGKGYAWIMLNFDNLSDENKDLLFSIESKTGDNGEKLGEKMIWFVHPFFIGNLDYKIRTGQYSYEYLKTCLSEDEIPKGIEFDERLAKFEKRHIVLGYGDRYPINTVIIRMPINEQTTAKEVEEYFEDFARMFTNQIVSKKQETEQGYKGYH
ncbi:MAG: hypothetical protein K2L98_03785 [Bacilli bacterium]|nr:hypothetical protein [Bacilli bacterium]